MVGTQSGLVIDATSTSPATRLGPSAGLRRMRTGPEATPGAAASPLTRTEPGTSPSVPAPPPGPASEGWPPRVVIGRDCTIHVCSPPERTRRPGGSVVPLDLHRHPCQRQQPVVVEHPSGLLIRGHRNPLVVPVRPADDLLGLRTEVDVRDAWAVLGHHIRVRLDLPSDDDLAEAERRLDDQAVAVACCRVGREHDPRRGRVDHALDDDRDRRLAGQSVRGAVGNDAGTPQGGPAVDDPLRARPCPARS